MYRKKSIMKQVLKKCLFLSIAFLVNVVLFVSCKTDGEDDIVDESYSNYVFSFGVIFVDSNDKLLSYSRDDIIVVKPLQDNHIILYEKFYDPVDFQEFLWIRVGSYGPDGANIHKMVLEMNHDNKTTTDTIVCEVFKDNDISAYAEYIWVNSTLAFDSQKSQNQIITIKRQFP